LDFTWVHTTWSVTVLWIFAVPIALVAGCVVAWSYRTRCGNVRVPVALGIAVVLQLVLLVAGGQHIPVLEWVAPHSYCFGNPGVSQVAALALPTVAVGATIWAGKRWWA
jgi:hypothetical protein